MPGKRRPWRPDPGSRGLPRRLPVAWGSPSKRLVSWCLAYRGHVREAELWQRLDTHLGPGYSRVWAEQIVLASLGGRTVVEALRAGIACKTIWRAVWAQLELPASQR